MIFVTVGSQKFQFDRLLKKIDEMISLGLITDSVYAQIGASVYIPQNYSYDRYIDRELFNKKINECDIVITHGGTGVIINAVKHGKKVIAIPRLSQYGEHVDDHQIQLLHQFDESGIILACYDVEDLPLCLTELEDYSFSAYKSNTDKIISSIDSFLLSLIN